MFHKPNSSILSNARKDASKKAKDVPLRKSDRKALRLVASSLLNCEDAETILDLLFLEGSLFSRHIQLTDAKATLYFRSPASPEETTDWPYHFHPQCIWIALDSTTLVPGNSSKPEILHVPTVALLSILPPGALALVRIHPEASKFVCRGADLMRPGIRGWQPSTKQQQAQAMLAVSVAVHGNPQAIAVGLLAPDLLNDFMANVKLTGVGVTIVTAYGDDLWKNQLPPSQVDSTSLSLFDLGHYGNAGFLEGKFVVPTLDDENDDESQASQTDEQHINDNDSQVKETDTCDAPKSDEIRETDNDGHGDTTQEDQVSPDDILHTAVCKALSMLQPEKKKLLPMRMATFYAQHVLPNRPEGTSIELKRTKYKKFTVYVAEQVEKGLLSVGVSQEGSRKDPMGMLVDFDARHAAIREFAELRKASGDSGAADAKDKRLVLTDLYCIPHHFQNLLQLDSDTMKATNATSNERRGTGMLTLKEMREILDDYIERENLVDPSNRNMIVIDGPLKDALYKQKKQSETAASVPTHIPKKDIITAWTAKMESAFALVEVPGSKVLRIGRGQTPCVTIEVSRRQSNKFVTQVRGFEDLGIDAETLRHEISQRFACASTVVTTQNSSKRTSTELLIQGNLAQELEALLTGDASKTKHGGAKDSPYCLPKNSIQKVLRKGVPAKGKKQ